VNVEKYRNLIWSGLLLLAAVAVIVWIIREQGATIDGALSNVNISPDEAHGETLNGLDGLNGQVDVAGSYLTYNVPEPGAVPPLASNQDYLTTGQAYTLGALNADSSVDNLYAVGLPLSDLIQ
jgi:hypothetical protein